MKKSMSLLFYGSFDQESFDFITRDIPKSSLTIFVSSTFTDTHIERSILHHEILPHLQSIGFSDDIQVIFYDMRFGVKDENFLDHMTWEICKDGIRHCHEESDGLFFLSLQGDKYGYMPLPKYVSYDCIATALNRNVINSNHNSGNRGLETSAKSHKYATDWYLMDENNDPVRFELKNLQESTKQFFFEEVTPTLRDTFLDSLPFEELPVGNKSEMKTFLLINRSITEWETLFALHLDKHRCFWIRKMFDLVTLTSLSKEGQPEDRIHEFCDFLQDPSRRVKMENLIEKMVAALGPIHRMKQLPSMYSFLRFLNACSSFTHCEENENCIFLPWKRVVEERLISELTYVRKRKYQFIEYLRINYALTFDYFQELLHHYRMVYLKAQQFYGRKHLVDQALSLFHQPEQQERSSSSICFAIIGKSGCGKTSLISVLASIQSNKLKASRKFLSKPSIPIIVRFCGTSRFSVHGLDLLQSISIQILLAFHQAEELQKYLTILPSECYDEAVIYFKHLLSTYPIYLFIDSLDQLSNQNEARSKLQFLKNIKLHPRSKIVVSTLPDEYDPKAKTYKYLYLCEKRLKEWNVPILPIEPITCEDPMALKEIIDALLMQKKQRKITSHQFSSFIFPAIQQEPTILYINLAIEVISKWKSFENERSIHLRLQPTVKGIIHQIFDNLEREYGKQFTSIAFSFITFSKQGINDIEMQDCLSLHEGVLKEVFQYSSISMFPMHVWLRLKSVIKYLIMEKENHCLKWYHRQISETAIERYEALGKVSHEIMGKYFGNILEESLRLEKKIHYQPLSFPNNRNNHNDNHYCNEDSIWSHASLINKRRINEAAYHLLESGLHNRCIEEICSLPIICAAVITESIFDYINYLSTIQQCFSSSFYLNTGNKQRLNHYLIWLKKDLSSLIANPRFSILLSASRQPVCSIVRSDADQYFELPSDYQNYVLSKNNDQSNNREKNAGGEDLGWIRAKELHDHSQFDAVEFNLLGHSDTVRTVSWSPNGKQIASGSEDRTVIIWDSRTGEMLNLFQGHIGGVLSVAWNSDSTFVASGSEDKSIKIWDIVNGEIATTLRGHTNFVTVILWNNSGTNVISGSDDGTIKIWDVVKGGKVVHTFTGHRLSISCLTWSPCYKKIASGSDDGKIYIWDVETMECVQVVTGKQFESSPRAASVAWNQYDNTLFSVWSGFMVPKMAYTIWDLQECHQHDNKCIQSLEFHGNEIAWSCFQNEKTQLIASASYLTIQIWDMKQKKNVSTFAQSHTDYILCLGWNNDGTKLASGSLDHTIKIWNVMEVKSSSTSQRNEDDTPIHSVSLIHQNVHQIAVIKKSVTEFWDLKTGELFYQLKKSVEVLAWNPNNHSSSLICFGSLLENERKSSIQIWDTITRKTQSKMDLGSVIHSLAWNPLGDKIVIGCDPHHLSIVNTANNNCQILFEFNNESDGCHQSGIFSLQWTQQNIIVSGSRDKTMKVWTPMKENATITMTGNDLGTFAIRPSGDVLAVCIQKSSLQLLFVASGKLCKEINETGPIYTLVWMTVTLIAGTCADGTIKIWETIQGNVVRSIPIHDLLQRTVKGLKAMRNDKIEASTAAEIESEMRIRCSKAISTVDCQIWGFDGNGLVTSISNSSLILWRFF